MTNATSTPLSLPTLADVLAAARRISPEAHRTPILTSAFFDKHTGGRLFFKCENFQRIGAFKFRGALNTLRSLTPEQLALGVVTHSSGNHAQATALAARMCGAQATVVMPSNSSEVKKRAVAGYGGKIVECEPTEQARVGTSERIVTETGGALIHPFNDARIIAGQGTAAVELLQDLQPQLDEAGAPRLDILMAPVGGGGLISGTAIAAAEMSPGTTVVGAEPAAADDAKRSLESGELQPMIGPKTVADGLRTSLGPLTFAAVRSHVSQIVTCSEASIISTMKLVWERMKIVIEPSSAVPLAAILEGNLDVRGKTVAIIISGGNVDLDALPWSE